MQRQRYASHYVELPCLRQLRTFSEKLALPALSTAVFTAKLGLSRQDANGEAVATTYTIAS